MIYHITTQSAWQQAQQQGVYVPAGFAQDGFIHCSDLHQVANTANRYYAQTPNLVVLVIDPGKAQAKLVYENLEGGQELFPHLYAHLPITAVVGTFLFDKDDDGGFALPTWAC